MYIERDFNLKPVRDFISNVQPKLNHKNIAEEVYENKELIGWEITNIG
jgi:signal recognition particle GTPase